MASIWQTLRKWIVNDNQLPSENVPDKIDWLRALPFLFMHLGCFLVFWVGYSEQSSPTSLRNGIG